MDVSFLGSPAFIVSALITVGAGGYAYGYLPRQMRYAYRQSLLTLAGAVETKDTGAVGHGERVAALVVATAQELGIAKSRVDRMEYAAFLQDIGNVRVPHVILNRAENLTPEDFEVVKAHATIGADVVERVTFLKDIAPIVRHHHEAWDGSGYPDGLMGEDIPLGARIIAICTAYDSMTHEKSWRAAMEEDEAVRTIRDGAGSRYDPAVVDAFLRALKKRQREEDRTT